MLRLDPFIPLNKDFNLRKSIIWRTFYTEGNRREFIKIAQRNPLSTKRYRVLGNEILFNRIESIILFNYLQLPTLVSTYCITFSYL
jgi:hypothetical protein